MDYVSTACNHLCQNHDWELMPKHVRLNHCPSSRIALYSGAHACRQRDCPPIVFSGQTEDQRCF